MKGSVTDSQMRRQKIGKTSEELFVKGQQIKRLKYQGLKAIKNVQIYTLVYLIMVK